jgi:uncharacterized damage-inducible protein DinB
MFTSVEGFKQTWKHCSESTSKVLAELTDKSLAQAVSKDDRTLGRMAWHLATAIPEMMGHVGLKIQGVNAEDPLPKTAAEIKKAYDAAAASLLEEISKNWKDDTLNIVDDMYGEKWPRGLTLRILIDHETHHRGQMTVLMRQAGLKVPGIMGPSRDEWSQIGMKPPEI